jgi:hypothetical protein
MTMANWSYRFSSLLASNALVAVIASIGGCSGSGVERAEVAGTVTVDGTPLPMGEIRFLPTAETKGPVWSASIKNGQYTTAGTKGTPVGDLRIEINGFRVPSWYKPPPGLTTEPEDMPPTEQYLPAKFNSQSELKLTIAPGSGRVEKDWELTSK